MSVPTEGKNFRLLRENELLGCLVTLTSFLPESLKFHQTLQTYIQDKIWKFHFYVSKDWPEVPICIHFPGVTDKSKNIFKSFGLFCPISHIDYLSLIRDENILIDWRASIYIHYVPTIVMNHLERLYSTTGYVSEKCYGDFYLCLEPEIIPHTKIRLDGKDAKMELLKKSDAKTIHDLYPANNIECKELFERIIKKLPSYGIYIRNQPVAWILQSYYGAMISMHTKPEFRRFGFGRILAHYLAQLIHARGYIPYCLVRSENSISRCLFISLGFRRLGEYVRGQLKPYE